MEGVLECRFTDFAPYVVCIGISKKLIFRNEGTTIFDRSRESSQINST